MWGAIVAGAVQLGLGVWQGIEGNKERRRAEEDLRNLRENAPTLGVNSAAMALSQYPVYKQRVEEEGLRASEAASLYAMQRDSRFMSLAPKQVMTTAMERRKSAAENEMIMRSGLQIKSNIEQQNQFAELENWRMLAGLGNERRSAGVYGTFQGANSAGLGLALAAKAIDGYDENSQNG